MVTVCPVAAWTSAARSNTWARSWSLAAVTRRASSNPRVSTPMWTFDPRRRLYPSYPARPPLSGVDWMVRPSSVTR